MYKKWRKNKNVDYCNWDAIVIGSGLSGLTTAAILALKGKKVLVLEAHDRPGGCLHTFSKNKVHFNTGNHYVGILDKDMTKVWNYITQNECELIPKDEKIVETFYDNGVKHELKTGSYEWQKTMTVDPKKVERMADRMKWFVFFKVLPYYLAYFLWLIFWLIYPDTIKTYDQWMTENSVSQGPWLMQEGDHGVKKDKCLAMVGAAVTRHYMHGVIHFPKNAVRQICKTIKNNNGAVFVDARVKSILTIDSKAKGVQLDDDSVFLSNCIISSIGITNTLKLTPITSLSKINLKSSVSHFSVFIGLRGSKKTLGLPDGNIWIREKHEQDVFISFDEQEEFVAVHILSPEKRNWFNMSSELYDKQKNKYANHLREQFYSYFPKIIKNEHVFIAGTPSTSKTFLNTTNGCSYGLECSSERFTDWNTVRLLKPETDINGLYITGQDILMMGICSALATGVITARQVLKFSLWDAITKQDIIDTM